MGIEKIISDKEELIHAVLKLVEGKEARAKLNLKGVEFHVGKSAVRMNGTVEITFIPLEEKR